MKYTIILTKQKEGGYTAQCLEIPGAITQGETKREALKNAKEAISLVLEVIREEASPKLPFGITRKLSSELDQFPHHLFF